MIISLVWWWQSIFDGINFGNADKVFGPNSNTEEVYDVAARPVVKAAMEGINGMIRLDFWIWGAWFEHYASEVEGICSYDFRFWDHEYLIEN